MQKNRDGAEADDREEIGAAVKNEPSLPALSAVRSATAMEELPLADNGGAAGSDILDRLPYILFSPPTTPRNT